MNIYGSLLKFGTLKLEPKSLNAKEKITVSYRYISWFLTSAFYLIEPLDYSLKYKIFVVITLLAFSRVVAENHLSHSTPKTVETTVLIEMMGLSILLVPTGGLESPFIWYALNPLLYTAIYLRPMYCWFNLSFYLTASVLINYKLFNVHGLTFAGLIQDKYYIILAYILVFFAIRLLSQMIDQLDQQAGFLKGQREELLLLNQKLQEANLSVKQSVEYVVSLYHIIEACSLRGDTQSGFTQMIDSAAKITKSQGAFLWLSSSEDEPGMLFVSNSSSYLKEALSSYLNRWEVSTQKVPYTFELENVSYLVARVQSSSRFYGYIGIELPLGLYEVSGFKKEERLDFLSELVALVLERHDYEKLSAKLMIMEEQNRIANEIHDSVSQRLFSIVCGIHTLKINWRTLDASMIMKQLQLIEQSAHETSKELRSSIYQLSSCKRGEKIFKEEIENYLHDFAHLNHVRVNFDFQGDEEKVQSSLRRAIYRIVREAAGNAVRHGHCTELEVSMSIHATTLELRVKDNGRGFNLESVLSHHENRGLGLNNMQMLTQSLNGFFELKSGENKGTELYFKFPLGLILESSIRVKGGAA